MSHKPRCPECRTRRATFTSLLKHMEETGHKPCGCGGYPYPHRKNSPQCESHPMAPYHQAAAQGATSEELEDIEMDIIWFEKGRPMLQFPE